MASAKLLELGEGICMEALRETLRPEQCSLGTRQLAAHRGAVRIGATLAIAARRVGGDGPRSEWYVHMREEGEDGSRLVWEGMLSFAVVDLLRFEREKTRPRPPAAAPQLQPQRRLVRNR